VQAERARRSSQLLLEATQAMARIGGWEVDMVNVQVYLTDEVYRILETSAQEYTPSMATTGRFFTPESASKVAAAIVHAVARWRFHFLARVGDDAFFRFDLFLRRVAPRHLLAGEELAMGSWLLENEHGPARAAELGGPPGFPAPRSLPYPGGMGYVFSYNVTAALAAAHARVGLADGYAEDVLVGLWLAARGRGSLRRIHTPCFHNRAEWAADAASPAASSTDPAAARHAAAAGRAQRGSFTGISIPP
jgi:hypothetical protein